MPALPALPSRTPFGPRDPARRGETAGVHRIASLMPPLFAARTVNRQAREERKENLLRPSRSRHLTVFREVVRWSSDVLSLPKHSQRFSGVSRPRTTAQRGLDTAKTAYSTTVGLLNSKVSGG